MPSDDYSAQVDEQDINSHDKEPLDLLVDDTEDTGIALLKDDSAEEEEDDEKFFMQQILETQYGEELPY